MTATIEYMGRPVRLVAGEAIFADSTVKVPQGAHVMVCAWCAEHRPATLRLLEHGYHVTHGLCTACASQIATANPKIAPVYAN